MRLPKKIMKVAAYLILGLFGTSIILGLTAVVYGVATDCPDTAGVYVHCN